MKNNLDVQKRSNLKKMRLKIKTNYNTKMKKFESNFKNIFIQSFN